MSYTCTEQIQRNTAKTQITELRYKPLFRSRLAPECCMQRINPNNIVKVKALKTELTFELPPIEGNTELTVNFNKKIKLSRRR